MRALVRSLLVASLPDDSEIPEDRWYGSGAIIGSPPTPFAEIRFGGRFRGMDTVVRRRLEVWVHDEEGDYGRIEDWLRYIKDVLDGATHLMDDAGNEIIVCTWVNDSTDLFDNGYRTNCMSATFELVGKEV